MLYAWNFCTRTENTAQQTVTFAGACKQTGKQHSVTVPAAELAQYEDCDVLIQDALVSVSVPDREFLMSGYSPEGFKVAMQGEDNEE